ncbi:MAG: putative nucleotidyltransferase [Myxococcota bacterium]|jgi:predicted nucleotidyltransferase
MHFDLAPHTILLTVGGSRAYGIHHDGSDVDVKGVAIPPGRTFHGFLESFDQCDDDGPIQAFLDRLTDEEKVICGQTKLEGVVYGLRKFARLCADSNPNLLETLFCRDDEIRVCTPLGERLRESRELFLSARARHTFAGYATSQLRRIKGHRRWLLHPPRAQPSRESYGLPQRTLIPADQLMAAEAGIVKKMDEWEVDYGSLERSSVIHIQSQIAGFLAQIMETTDARWRCASRMIGYDENFMALLDRERRYKSAMKEWQQYQSWKKNRNAARAELESRFGFDVKHGAHLIRLLRMGREILIDGKVNVWRGDIDAEELIAIRQGQWSYERLIEEAEAENAGLEEIWQARSYVVPKAPDLEKLDALVVELVESALRSV